MKKNYIPLALFLLALLLVVGKLLLNLGISNKVFFSIAYLLIWSALLLWFFFKTSGSFSNGHDYPARSFVFPYLASAPSSVLVLYYASNTPMIFYSAVDTSKPHFPDVLIYVFAFHILVSLIVPRLRGSFTLFGHGPQTARTWGKSTYLSIGIALAPLLARYLLEFCLVVIAFVILWGRTLFQ